MNYDRNSKNVFKYYEAFFHYEIGFKTPIKAIFLVKIGKKLHFGEAKLFQESNIFDNHHVYLPAVNRQGCVGRGDYAG